MSPPIPADEYERLLMYAEAFIVPSRRQSFIEEGVEQFIYTAESNGVRLEDVMFEIKRLVDSCGVVLRTCCTPKVMDFSDYLRRHREAMKNERKKEERVDLIPRIQQILHEVTGKVDVEVHKGFIAINTGSIDLYELNKVGEVLNTEIATIMSNDDGGIQIIYYLGEELW